MSASKKVLLLGFDWGTNKSCIKACYTDTPDTVMSHIVPTVVGYAAEGILENLLPRNAKVLFGQEALRYRLHLKMAAPMQNGVLADASIARDFAQHISSLLEAPEGTELRAVIGMPANSDKASLENMRRAVMGLFHKVILIPEPFLAALGYRDESQLSKADYIDPVRNSMFVDIGAGTTDVCLVQGYYPTAEEQVSFAFAGDKVDALLSESIKRKYPDCDLSMMSIREIKEQYSYVSQSTTPVQASVLIGGKRRAMEVGEQIKSACEELLKRTFEAVDKLIGKASSESVGELLQNIILTGGGSQIKGLDAEIERLLTEAGYENPKVRTVGQNYKEFVAKGALKAARQAREDQWQQVIL